MLRDSYRKGYWGVFINWSRGEGVRVTIAKYLSKKGSSFFEGKVRYFYGPDKKEKALNYFNDRKKAINEWDKKGGI